MSNAPAWMSRGGDNNSPIMRGGAPPDHRDSFGRNMRDAPPPRDYYNRGGPPPHRGGFPRGGGGGRGPPPSRRGPPRGNRSGIVFRSYEEERAWVEERRRKRMERKTKWDILPTPEQAAVDAQQSTMQNFAATDFSGAAVDSGLPQQTRHARRLYLGNLPPNVTEQELHDFFLHAIQETSSTPLEEDPILSVYINYERRFCFLEFKTVEMTTACLQLDGINVNQKGKIHIKRPNDYNPIMAPKVHPSKIPQLDVSKLGIVAKTVPDGPNKIFVGGLHYHLNEDQVLELLQAFGPVKAFHLVTNDPSGLNSKGYCFVEYCDPSMTQVAIMGLNGMDLGGGKVLTARIAAAREDESQQVVAAAAAVGASTGANIVDGYNVDALLDAAMGLRPMPTAPIMMSEAGGGGGMMTAAMNNQGIMPVTATPLDIANQALEAAFSGGGPPQQAAVQNNATRVLVLHNMVTDQDLQTAEDHAALVEEVRYECAKYGSLVSMQIPRPTDANYEPSAIRKVFLEYASPNDALAANRELAGRQFGDSVVEVSVFVETCICLVWHLY